MDPGILEPEMTALMEQKENLSLRVTSKDEWMDPMNGSQV